MLELGVMVVDIIAEKELRDIEKVLVTEIIPVAECIAIVMCPLKYSAVQITNLLWLL